MNYSPTPYTTHVPWQVQPTDPVILPWILPGQALQPNWLHPLTQNRYMGKALGKLTPLSHANGGKRGWDGTNPQVFNTVSDLNNKLHPRKSHIPVV